MCIHTRDTTNLWLKIDSDMSECGHYCIALIDGEHWHRAIHNVDC